MEKQWPTLLRCNAPRLYKCYNHSLSPYARPAHAGKSWPLAVLQELQNSGSQMFVLTLKE